MHPSWPRGGAAFIRRRQLPDDTFSQQDRFGKACCHWLLAEDQRKQEPEILLRPPQVIAEGRTPLVAVGLQSVLKVPFLERLLDRVGGVEGRPAVGVDVFG